MEFVYYKSKRFLDPVKYNDSPLKDDGIYMLAGAIATAIGLGVACISVDREGNNFDIICVAADEMKEVKANANDEAKTWTCSGLNSLVFLQKCMDEFNHCVPEAEAVTCYLMPSIEPPFTFKNKVVLVVHGVNYARDFAELINKMGKEQALVHYRDVPK